MTTSPQDLGQRSLMHRSSSVQGPSMGLQSTVKRWLSTSQYRCYGAKAAISGCRSGAGRPVHCLLQLSARKLTTCSRMGRGICQLERVYNSRNYK